MRDCLTMIDRTQDATMTATICFASVLMIDLMHDNVLGNASLVMLQHCMQCLRGSQTNANNIGARTVLKLVILADPRTMAVHHGANTHLAI